MFGKAVIICVPLLTLVRYACGVKPEQIYTEVKNNEGKVCAVDSEVFGESLMSIHACAFKCMLAANCTSFFYKESTETCTGCERPCGESVLSSEHAQIHCWNEKPVKPRDCMDIKQTTPGQQDGVYSIVTAAGIDVDVYCIMTEYEGGWTVFLRRFDGEVQFNKTFVEYEEGFGDVDGEHWLGLQTMHAMTSRIETSLFASFGSFPSKLFPADIGTEHIADFEVGPGPSYTLFLGEVLVKEDGEGESLDEANGTSFKAYDTHPAFSKSEYGRGGWWYINKWNSINPTGLYKETGYFGRDSIVNGGFRGLMTLANVTIMFRRI